MKNLYKKKQQLDWRTKEWKFGNVVIAVEFRGQYFAAGVAAPTRLDGNGSGGVVNDVIDNCGTAAHAADVLHGRLHQRAPEFHRVEASAAEARNPFIHSIFAG